MTLQYDLKLIKLTIEYNYYNFYVIVNIHDNTI